MRLPPLTRSPSHGRAAPQVTETIESVTTESLESGRYANGTEEASATTTLDREYETAETEQVSHMEQEERKTFVITGVRGTQEVGHGSR